MYVIQYPRIRGVSSLCGLVSGEQGWFLCEKNEEGNLFGVKCGLSVKCVYRHEHNNISAYIELIKTRLFAYQRLEFSYAIPCINIYVFSSACF